MPDHLMDPRVDAYIEKAASFAQPILSHLRSLMHRACPQVSESIKWSMPFFLYDGVILANMAAFKQHCAFGFWGPEMQKMLEKDGHNSSNALGSLGRITALKDLPPDRQLLAYMKQAVDLVQSGERTKSIERPKKVTKRPVRVPPELLAAITRDKWPRKRLKPLVRAIAVNTPTGSLKPSARKHGKSVRSKQSSGSRKGSRATGST